MVDDDKGPSTKREYEIARVPAGDALTGKVVDFLGRAPGSQVQLGTSAMVPLFGEQPDMESREQIAEPLLTGVKVRMWRPVCRLQGSLLTCYLRSVRALSRMMYKRTKVAVLTVAVCFATQALDAMTPLGRGQALLVTGEQPSGKSSVVLDAILGQSGTSVRCIYAAIGQRCALPCFPCRALFHAPHMPHGS